MTFIALSLGARARQAAAAAQNQQRVAFSRELAAASISNLEIDPERSILLAMEAISVTYAADKTWTAEAEDALHRALTVSRVQLTLRGHTDRVWAVAFSPDGTRLATASDDGTAKIWDASSGQELFTLSTEATRGHHGLALSPDGTRLATASGVGTAKVWDVATGKVLLSLHGHTDWVSSVIFSPDGTRLATASEDGTVKVWDATTGQELLTLQGHTLEIWDVAFNSDGSRLATSGEDGKVKVWEAVSGKELFTLAGHAGPVYSVAFTPDGNRLPQRGTGTQNLGRCTGPELFTLHWHSQGVWAVAFSSDGGACFDQFRRG
jgi:WD40 repeat protein